MNAWLIPLCLFVGELANMHDSLPACAPLAGFVGAMLGSYILSHEMFPWFTLWGWLRLVMLFTAMRGTWIVILIVCAIAMPDKPGVATLVISGALMCFIFIWLFWLFMRSLRWIKMLRRPDQRLRSIVAGTSNRIGVPEPRTWLLDVPLALAFAMPTTGELAFSSRLLEISSDDEISAICAHELAHLMEPKRVLLARIAGSLSFFPLIFLRPAINFGPSAVCAIAGLVLLAIILVRKLARRMETRADKFATEKQCANGVYARALEKLYRDSLIPAVSSTNNKMHPHLYDRMLAAGIQPDFPLPAKPKKRAWPSYLIWIALGLLLGLYFAK
jgi:Zn-dependent protease with chaperone function